MNPDPYSDEEIGRRNPVAPKESTTVRAFPSDFLPAVRDQKQNGLVHRPDMGVAATGIPPPPKILKPSGPRPIRVNKNLSSDYYRRDSDRYYVSDSDVYDYRPSRRRRRRHDRHEAEALMQMREYQAQCIPDEPVDVSIHLELSITEDVEDDLEQFARLRRLGDFRGAQALFVERLQEHGTNPYVFVQYAEMLLEKGDYKALEALNPSAVPGFDAVAASVDKGESARDESGEAEKRLRLLYWNWSLVKAISMIHTQDMVQDAVCTVSRAVEDIALDSTEIIESTEIRIIVLCLGVLARTRHCAAYAEVHRLKEQVEVWTDWADVMGQLWAQSRDWDMADLSVGLVLAFGQGKLGTWLNEMRRDRMDEIDVKIGLSSEELAEDEVVVVSHLDGLISFILDSNQVEVPPDGVQGQSLMRRAAECIMTNYPATMRSRPFVRWLLIQAEFGNGRGLSRTVSPVYESLNKEAGHLLYSTRPMSLPLYVPKDTEIPTWPAKEAPAGDAEPIRLALNLAKELHDYETQALCYRLLAFWTANPEPLLKDLCYLQGTVQGDRSGHLETLVSRFIGCRGELAQRRLLAELDEFKDIPVNNGRRDITLYFGYDVVSRALRRHLDPTIREEWMSNDYFHLLMSREQAFVDSALTPAGPYIRPRENLFADGYGVVSPTEVVPGVVVPWGRTDQRPPSRRPPSPPPKRETLQLPPAAPNDTTVLAPIPKKKTKKKKEKLPSTQASKPIILALPPIERPAADGKAPKETTKAPLIQCTDLVVFMGGYFPEWLWRNRGIDVLPVRVRSIVRSSSRGYRRRGRRGSSESYEEIDNDGVIWKPVLRHRNRDEQHASRSPSDCGRPVMKRYARARSTSHNLNRGFESHRVRSVLQTCCSQTMDEEPQKSLSEQDPRISEQNHRISEQNHRISDRPKMAPPLPHTIVLEQQEEMARLKREIEMLRNREREVRREMRERELEERELREREVEKETMPLERRLPKTRENVGERKLEARQEVRDSNMGDGHSPRLFEVVDVTDDDEDNSMRQETFKTHVRHDDADLKSQRMDKDDIEEERRQQEAAERSNTEKPRSYPAVPISLPEVSPETAIPITSTEQVMDSEPASAPAETVDERKGLKKKKKKLSRRKSKSKDKETTELGPEITKLTPEDAQQDKAINSDRHEQQATRQVDDVGLGEGSNTQEREIPRLRRANSVARFQNTELTARFEGVVGGERTLSPLGIDASFGRDRLRPDQPPSRRTTVEDDIDGGEGEQGNVPEGGVPLELH